MAAIERAVPYNLDAEEAAIGSVLIDGSALHHIRPFLRPEHFYVEKNGWIFQAMLAVGERREPVDVLTVCDELERQGQLQEAGGAAYVTSLLNAVPTSVHAEHYGRLVERTAVLRQLLTASGDIARLAYDSQDDADAALDAAEKVVFGIRQSRAGRGTMYSASDLMGEYMEYLDLPAEAKIGRRVATGFADLDCREMLAGGLPRAALCLLAARPATGKTSLALCIAHRAILVSQRVAFFSLEMARQEITNRLLAIATGMSTVDLERADFTDGQLAQLSRQFGQLSETRLFVDDASGVTVPYIGSKCRRLQMEHGKLDLVIVDYLQLMGTPRRENRVQEIGALSQGLVALAKELDAPVLALSQLSRAPENRMDHRPVLSDLRDSGALEQDARVVLFLYLDKKDEEQRKNDVGTEVEVTLAKHSNGPTGQRKLTFLKWCTRFENYEAG